MGIERRAIRSKEPHERLVAPDTHRLSAKIRRPRYAIRVAIRRRGEHRVAQYVVERFIRVEHERPRRLHRRKRKASRVEEIRPVALDDARPGASGERDRTIPRARIEHEHSNAARQARERTRQIALFVARQNDGGDYTWVQEASATPVSVNSARDEPLIRSSCASAAPMKAR